jgi:serine/threonine-protein kinase
MLMAPRPAGSTRTSLHAPSLSEQLYGTPKIADFGLAKRLEEDSGQTRSGTILGTPSYMSPEQAGGQLKQVGPHSDQYALGAILYEMLTGRPPFDGTSVWETIEQVRTREPVPPSRLQPRVPRDLETICLKCLQKEPRQRYADAAALAEDLRRFVANEPILARPVSAPERLWRWCRRNPTIAAPSFTALLLLLAFMAFLMVHNRQLSDFTVQLGAEKKQTEIQRDAANTAREQAEKNERRAEKDRGVALKALGAFVSNVQEELGRRPGQQELQKKLLKIAMGHLGGVSKSTTAKVNLNDSTLAAAHLNLGMVFLRLGETKAGMEELRQAESIYRAIVESAPDDPDGRANQANQAVALRQLGLAHLGQSQTDEAVACFRKAADLMAALEERRAGDKVSVADVKAERANSLDSLGFLASVTRLREARGYYQQALDLRRQVADLRKADGRRWDEARSALARSYLLVGGADFRLRNPASTEELYRDAVALRAELAKAHPANAVVQSELGYARQRLGDFYLRTQRPEAAAPEYEGAEQLYAALVKQDPKRADYQDFLARALGDAGLAALRRGDKALAAKKYHAALAIREARAQVHDDMDVQKGLMMALARCGDHRRAAALAEQIRKRAPDSRDDLYDVACCFGVCAGIEVPAGGSPDERRLRDRYAADAVQALREAINRGHRDVVNVETEPDFDAIRDRADFKALVAELARTAEP